MSGLRGWLLRWGPALLWMALIFTLSAQPKTDLPDYGSWDLLVKKGAHLVAYATLAVLVFRAVGDRERPYLSALLIVATFAVSDEIHQLFVPGRTGRWYDVLVDLVGASLALWGIAWLAGSEKARPWLARLSIGKNR